jgi:hypothetical protein
MRVWAYLVEKCSSVKKRACSNISRTKAAIKNLVGEIQEWDG